MNEIISPENLVYKKPTLMNDTPMHYCPGCSHGVVHKLVAEVIEEMGMEDKAVGICPVGCAVFAYRYVDIDWQEAAHGRALACASAVKRLWPDRLVFTYQGDGDLACIGACETIHALNRGEHVATIFINNAIYGMTGGQMAPTTLLGQKTSTCPYGREPDLHGYPLNITELASHLTGTCYVTRQSVESVASIRKAKRAIRKAFEASMKGLGSSLVEIVSTCNSGWKLSPVASKELWIQFADVEEYNRRERELYRLLMDSEGDDQVVIYVKKEKMKVRLRFIIKKVVNLMMNGLVKVLAKCIIVVKVLKKINNGNK